MFSKWGLKDCLVNGSQNLEKYVSVLENFLIARLEDLFQDSDVIFIDGNASCHKSQRVKKKSENIVPQSDQHAVQISYSMQSYQKYMVYFEIKLY